MGNGEWREYESLDYQGIGYPLYVWWGEGRDEHSPNAAVGAVMDGWTFVGGRVGDAPDVPGSSIRRCTWTSPVVHKELLAG